MKFSVEQKIKELIKQALEKAEISYEGNVGLEHPGEEAHGDYASNIALQIQKSKCKIQNDNEKCKDFKTPRELAELIVNNFPQSNLIEKVVVAGPGFINFWLAKEYLLSELEKVTVDKDDYGSAKKDGFLNGKKFMVEFAHPNTHKMFHIGHLRNATTGETLVRILEANGTKIIRANYEGDVGLHIAKCLYSIIKYSNDVILGSQPQAGDSKIKGNTDSGQARMTKLISDLENEYKTIKDRVEFLGKMYTQGNKAYEENPEAKKEILEINKKIYAKDPEFFDLWKVTRQWSLDYFETIYKRIYTHFDRYYFESEVWERGKELVMNNIKKGIFKESDGAIVFQGEKFGTHTRVFVTQEGNTTYEGKDMALGELQFKECNPDLIIHCVGPEQAEYFKVIFEALGQLFPGMKEKEKHVPYGWVKLKMGKMSSREGNVVLGEWLLDEAKEKVKKIMQTVIRGGNDSSSEKRSDESRSNEALFSTSSNNNTEIAEKSAFAEATADKIAVGAVKYSFLKVALSSEIAFDFTESISFEGDSGPYLMYTYARTRSVLAKSKAHGVILGSPAQPDDSRIVQGLQPEEISLLRWLYRYPEVVMEAGQNYTPNLICSYLFNLAQKYNLFYNKLPILKAEAEELVNFRLMLNEAVGIILKNGLDLLGIEEVEKM